MCWDAVTSFGTWFSAVSTFLAVLVALFLPYWQNRKRVKVGYKLNMLAADYHSLSDSADRLTPYACFTCLNVGRTDFVVQWWYLKITGSVCFDINPIKLFSPDLKNVMTPGLPKRLSPDDVFQCGIEGSQFSEMLSELLVSGKAQCDDFVSICFCGPAGKVFAKKLDKNIQEIIDFYNTRMFGD